MATLMTFKNAFGRAGRCDAKCYDAKHEGCVCCCGGRNHRAGFTKALKNTIEHFDSMVEASKKERDPRLRATNIKKNKKFIRYFEELKKQGSLFGKEDEDQLLERAKKARL